MRAHGQRSRTTATGDDRRTATTGGDESDDGDDLSRESDARASSVGGATASPRTDAKAPRPDADPDGLDGDQEGPDTDAVLGLLGDEYVCDILRALADGPRPAREIADACGMSRATVYRRLERLTAAGLVDSRFSLETDGNHRQHFRLVVDALELRVGDGGVDGHLATDANPDHPRN